MRLNLLAVFVASACVALAGMARAQAPAPTPNVTLTADQTEVAPSANGNTIRVKATATAAGQPVVGAGVDFSVRAGAFAPWCKIGPPHSQTDANGVATATLTSTYDGSTTNMVVTVVATETQSGESGITSVTILGYHVIVTSDAPALYTAGLYRPKTTIHCQALDSQNQPVQGSITFSTDNGTLSGQPAFNTTDELGRASVELSVSPAYLSCTATVEVAFTSAGHRVQPTLKIPLIAPADIKPLALDPVLVGSRARVSMRVVDSDGKGCPGAPVTVAWGVSSEPRSVKHKYITGPDGTVVDWSPVLTATDDRNGVVTVTVMPDEPGSFSRQLDMRFETVFRQ